MFYEIWASNSHALIKLSQVEIMPEEIIDKNSLFYRESIGRFRFVCQENRRHNIWFFGYSVTCGLVNDAKVGESGLLTD